MKAISILYHFWVISSDTLSGRKWIFGSIEKSVTEHSSERIVSHQLQVVNFLTDKAGQRRNDPHHFVPAFKFVLKKFLQHPVAFRAVNSAVVKVATSNSIF